MTASFACCTSNMKRDSSLRHSQGWRVEEEDGKSKDMPKSCHPLAPRHGSPLPHRQTDHAKAPQQPRKGLRSQLRSLFLFSIIHHHIIAETAPPALDDTYHHLKPSRQDTRACKTSLSRLARATDSRHLLRPLTRRAAADDISNQLLRLCEEESFSFSGSAVGD